MKKIHYLIINLFLLVIASTALAEGIKPGSFSISGIAGGYTFDSEEQLKTRPVTGIRAGYNFNRIFGVEALFNYVPTESKTTSEDADAYRYGGDLLVHFMPDTRLVPFLAVGIGAMTIEYDNLGTETSAAFNYGPGIKFFLSDNLALRGDLRHIILRNNQENLNNFEYTIGITYQFGGMRAAPAAAEAEAPVAAPVSKPEAEATPAPQAEAPLKPVPAAEPTAEMMKYCVALKIEFDIDRAEIRPQYNEEVAKVGDFMKKHPTTTAVIEGHTDEVGSDDYNMQLSQKRAESVVKYLINNFGIDASRLSARGYGKTMPVSDSKTDEARQKNRRIDAIIDCAFDFKEVTAPLERLCMNLKVQFNTDSAVISPIYYGEVNTVGEYMQKYPTTTALIEGHTDNIGGYDHNMILSQQRAESIVNYLVEKFGIDRTRLSAKGYGPNRHIAYNNTAEGRQKNRRINAVIDCVIKK